MFFIGIFGFEKKEKVLRDISSLICPVCGRYTAASLVYVYTYFHFFFLPLFRWNKKYYVRLRCCGALYQADRETAAAIENGADVDFAKLQRVFDGFGNYDEGERRCPNCGSAFSAEYPHCPYCGTRYGQWKS